MADDTIPDALAADLRELFLAAQPLSPALPDNACRLKLETNDLPSPRLVFVSGEPRRVQGQDGTARVPFELKYISSMDRETPDVHRAIAGKIDAWLRAVRIDKRRALLGSRSWLHDMYVTHPIHGIDTEQREQTAAIRGEAIITLAITEPA